MTLEENSHPGLLEGREGVRAVAKRHADQKSESQQRGTELARGHHGQSKGRSSPGGRSYMTGGGQERLGKDLSKNPCELRRTRDQT